MANTELKPCPFCGRKVEIHGGPEEWEPTWYDPDSGGDPYYIACDCGCHFCIGCVDLQDITEAWNRRVESVEILDCEKCAFNDGIAYWHQCAHCIGQATNNFVSKEEITNG